MKQLRTIVFWIHLSVALLVGLVVVIMSTTGATIAFEKEILEWAERGQSAPGLRDPASRLSIEELLARVAAARPEAPAATVTLRAERSAPVRVGTGREGGVLVDPFTGEVRELPGQGWRTFLRQMTDWHRALGAEGERRALGRAITGVANAGFLFLALSGLYLWWPRRWSGRSLRLSLWFRRGLGSKTRDWNWHNVIGFWSLPVLIVVTSSGLMISYRWASNLIYTLAGEAPPAAGPGGGAPVTVPAPAPGTPALPLEALVRSAGEQVPAWRTITLRLRAPAAQEQAARPRRREGGGAQATVLSVKETRAWPRFATTQLSLDPFTGKVLRKESYADYTRGRRIRTWMRFLHTGEALGWPGQVAAATASLGSVLLAWTGFALAWRRFFRRKVAAASGGAAEVVQA
jgi:uncharacterized iron-regulated membrane protein